MFFWLYMFFISFTKATLTMKTNWENMTFLIYFENTPSMEMIKVQCAFVTKSLSSEDKIDLWSRMINNDQDPLSKAAWIINFIAVWSLLPFRFVLWKIDCPACRTSLIATRFWVVVICPIIKCLIVLEFYFILFDLCLFITSFNFILNYVPSVTFWIFTYHKIWILLIIFCFIWNYWITYFLTCLEVFWSVVS